MKYIRFLLPALVLFLSIGYAATNITLSISGDAYIASDIDDFEVYISGIQLDGTEDISLLKSTTEFEYSTDGGNGTTTTIGFDITNASTKFDAAVTIECSEVEETLTITTNLDSDEPINAMTTQSGTVEIYADGVTSNTAVLTCTITATPVERTTYGEGEIPDVLVPIFVGDEVTIGTEEFHVVKVESTTVSLLADYNLDTSYNQTSGEYANVIFSSIWDNEAFAVEGEDTESIDLEKWAPEPYEYLLAYKEKIVTAMETQEITATLLSADNLRELGCAISITTLGTSTCVNSEYLDILNNSQSYWLKSANVLAFSWAKPYYFVEDGTISYQEPEETSGIRPVIEIPYTVLNSYLLSQNNDSS